MIVFTDDKDRLLRHFEKDPVLFAYHIGDLDDFHFPYCQWASLYADRPHIVDCVLVYTGLDKPTVLAFGLTERFDQLLDELVDLLPVEFYCHFQKPSLPILTRSYECTPFGPHYKMTVEEFVPSQHSLEPGAEILKLDRSHEPQVRELYDTAYPKGYFATRMLDTGRYVAMRKDGKLRSIAGVHVDSAANRIAVLGGIATEPAYRGRGYASVLTSQLTQELLTGGRRVALNVEAGNQAAIRCYEKLGFVRTHEYEEGFFTRKQ